MTVGGQQKGFRKKPFYVMYTTESLTLLSIFLFFATALFLIAFVFGARRIVFAIIVHMVRYDVRENRAEQKSNTHFACVAFLFVIARRHLSD